MIELIERCEVCGREYLLTRIKDGNGLIMTDQGRCFCYGCYESAPLKMKGSYDIGYEDGYLDALQRIDAAMRGEEGNERR